MQRTAYVLDPCTGCDSHSNCEKGSYQRMFVCEMKIYDAF